MWQMVFIKSSQVNRLSAAWTKTVIIRMEPGESQLYEKNNTYRHRD